MNEIQVVGQNPVYYRFFSALMYCVQKRGRGVQVSLAIETKKSEAFISKLLKGENRASLDTQVAIAKAFGYEYEDFLRLGRHLLDPNPPEKEIPQPPEKVRSFTVEYGPGSPASIVIKMPGTEIHLTIEVKRSGGGQ